MIVFFWVLIRKIEAEKSIPVEDRNRKIEVEKSIFLFAKSQRVRYLESVETADLSGLDLRHEPLDEVLVDDAVRGGEEGQDVLDEVLLALFQLFPIVIVAREVDLFSRPERGNRFFVEAPDVLIFSASKTLSKNNFFEKNNRFSTDLIIRLESDSYPYCCIT